GGSQATFTTRGEDGATSNVTLCPGCTKEWHEHSSAMVHAAMDSFLGTADYWPEDPEDPEDPEVEEPDPVATLAPRPGDSGDAPIDDGASGTAGTVDIGAANASASDTDPDVSTHEDLTASEVERVAAADEAAHAAKNKCLGCGADEVPIVEGYCSDVCEAQHKADVSSE
ncbi:MAG: hypothetical protein V3U45_03850, partial [bacterium]